MSGGPRISAFPEADNMFSWVGTINGVKDTVYEGLVYKLSLHFPNDYPFNPPEVKFETPCFHPNVDQNGNICLDILQVGVLSFFVVFQTLTCKHLLYGVQSITFCTVIPTQIWLQDKWSSACDVRTILLSIQSLLGGK